MKYGFTGDKAVVEIVSFSWRITALEGQGGYGSQQRNCESFLDFPMKSILNTFKIENSNQCWISCQLIVSIQSPFERYPTDESKTKVLQQDNAKVHMYVKCRWNSRIWVTTCTLSCTRFSGISPCWIFPLTKLEEMARLK